MAFANYRNESILSVLSLISKIITFSSHSSTNYDELIGDTKFKAEIIVEFLMEVTYFRSLVR